MYSRACGLFWKVGRSAGASLLQGTAVAVLELLLSALFYGRVYRHAVRTGLLGAIQRGGRGVSAGHTAIPWRVAPPLVSTAPIMIGAGVLGSLLPLRFSAWACRPARSA